MAKFVVVFNCSEGMDYATLNQAFCGLCQTGSWGCLDEFNRIRSDVLSVIGQQFSTILNAMSLVYYLLQIYVLYLEKIFV